MQPLKPQPDPLRDEITVVDDAASGGSQTSRAASQAYWKVLVVDDDPEVHTVTRFILQQARILGRPIKLIEAHGSREAQTRLLNHPDIAVILLDVVMEEHDSGLKLARWIREAGLEDVRIVLRTGQPGYAPELDVIRDYDINDYRAKNELTQTRLITSMTAALRSYQQIETIERSRRGLEMIISSCSQLFQKRELADFSQGVLLQIASLCGVSGEGLICAAREGPPPEAARIVSGLGALSAFIGRRLSDLPDSNALKAATVEAIRQNTLSTEGPLVLSVDGLPDRKFVASLDHSDPLDSMDSALLRVFATNIAVGFENVGLIERLDRLAYWDESTGLPNRHKLIMDMADRVSHGNRVVLIRVVSYFETLVAFGQVVATGLLCEIAAWLTDAGAGGEVYRHAEDVLGVIVTPDSPQEKLLAELPLGQFVVKGHAMRARFVMGCASLEHGMDAAAVCEQAYVAMALAGAENREGIVAFETAFVHDARDRIELIAALRDALEDGEVDIVFQPVVRTSDQTCMGFEALARWTRHGKPVSPADFIPLAEQVGLTLKILELGVRRSAQWLKRLQAEGRTGHYVSINLAPCDLERHDLVPWMVNLLGRAGLPPALLQIEITEQSLVRDFPAAERNLSSLKNLGCRIAIDDFGAGYSSLSYIGRLPVDVLKLDRQFVIDIAESQSSQAIVGLTAALAQRLGLDVLAEGVETMEQQDALEGLGLRYAQGYRFARPMTCDQLSAWLKGDRSAGSA